MKEDNKTCNSIEIDGKVYPCFPTMGANFDFKDETGREASHMDPESITDLVTYMWCQTRGACRRRGVEFNMGLREFADRLDPEDVEKWGQSLIQSQSAATANDDKKKATNSKPRASK